jgi:thiamine pyrophosphokinase
MAIETPVLSSAAVDIFLRARRPDSTGGVTLFVLGGRPPEPEWMRDFAMRNSPEVWAVDSGVGACRRAGLSPAAMVGDRDSADPDDWAWALSGGAVEHIYFSDKNRTDFQLALHLWREGRGKTSESGVSVLSGCFGGRFDHLMSVVGTYALSGEKSSRCMIDDAEGAFFIYSGEEAGLAFRERPEAISLIPLSDVCAGVSISGVRWPLDSVTLQRAYPWTVSNETPDSWSAGDAVTVSCGDGICAVYWC